ncbi:MAG: hypothetical protein JJE44_04590 [Flavobacteriaceae bacterium]|nr:hypothetical protein [Flavobacteriaceae bacterium]
MKLLIYIICCFYAISSYAQKAKKSHNNDTDETTATFELREVALLDLEPSNATVRLDIVSPKEAGKKAEVVTTNNNKWINFSSAVSDDTASRSISIEIEDGQVPPGIYLKLGISNYVGSGDGVLGSAVSRVTLNNTSQTIVSGIRGAYTGNGENNGYKLSYNLEIYDYKLLDFDQSATLNISLTLSDL